MHDETRLKWVARNRRRESNVERIGSRIADFAEALERRTLSVEEAIGSLAGVVDNEFRDLCRIEGIENGVLRLGVAEASAIANLSRKWSMRLRQTLPAKLKIKRIAFAYGTRGYRID